MDAPVVQQVIELASDPGADQRPALDDTLQHILPSHAPQGATRHLHQTVLGVAVPQPVCHFEAIDKAVEDAEQGFKLYSVPADADLPILEVLCLLTDLHH